MALGPHPTRLDDASHRLAAGWWNHTSTGPGPVFADGVIDVVWWPGSDLWLAGPDTGPSESNVPAGAPILGLSLRTGAAGALSRCSTTELADQRIGLDAILSAGTVRRLTDRLEHEGVGFEAAKLLADELALHLPTDWQPDPIVEAACTSLRRSGRIEDALAGPATLSSRQLRRRFSDAVGYGPTFYKRVCRLNHFVNEAAAATATDRSIGQLAAESGYHDQSHLVRDCRALTGLTPTQLLA